MKLSRFNKCLSVISAIAVLVGTIQLNSIFANASSVAFTNLTPSASKAVEQSTEDGAAVYSKEAKWLSVGGMVFNYKIESGKKYLLTFDYEVPGNELNTGKFAWKPPQASTVKSSGAYEEREPANAVKLGLPASGTIGWTAFGQLLEGDDLLNSGVEGTEYLQIDWGWLNDGRTVRFKNIKIAEVEAAAGVLYPSTVQSVETSVDGEDIAFTKIPQWLNTGGMVFNYKIESGKKYFLTFDYNVPGTAGGSGKFATKPPQVSTVKSPDVYEERETANAIKLDLPTSYTNGWTSFGQMLDGDKLLNSGVDGTEYLQIDWGLLNNDCTVRFKNIKIAEIEPDSDVLLPTGTVSFNACIEDGVICYKTIGTENNLWTNGGDNSLVFDYKIERGYKYLLTYDYRYTYDAACDNTPISAYVSTSSTKPFTGGVKDKAFRLNTSEKGWWNTWATGTTMLSGDALLNLNAGEYFTIISTFIKPYSLRNIRIEKFVASDEYIYPSGAANFNTCVEDGNICYKTIGTENSLWTNGGDNSLVFDYKIEREYNYLLFYDYRYTYDDACDNTPISAYVSTSNTKPFTGGVKDKAFRLNTSSEGFNNKWASGCTSLSGEALLNLNAGEYLTIISTFIKPYTLKNIQIVKYKPSGFDPDIEYVTNGNFENGLTGWRQSENVAEAVTKDGSTAMKLNGGYYSYAYQRIILPKPDVNYKLSFKYKGKVSEVAVWGLSKNTVSTAGSNLIQKGRLTSSDNWNNVETVFSAADTPIIYILFRSDSSSEYYVTDVSVKQTKEPVTYTPPEEYTEPSLGETYGVRVTNFEYNVPVDYPVSYICADEDNLITGGSLENNGNWNQGNLFGAGVVSVVSATEDSKAHSGSKMLKYSAVGLEREKTWSAMFFDVEPNTEYYFTAFVRGEKWSDTNKCDMYLGIVNPETGKFVPQGFKANKRYDENRQYSVAYDNEWHMIRGVVNSGSATQLGIGFSGGNAVAYIDDMYFFKSEDKVEYKTPKLSIKDASASQNTPEKIGCEDSDNLFDNYDISDVSGDTFWTSGKGFFPTVKLAETGSTKGNAIYYSENTYGTGYPKGTYYIKWIDVDANTDYTFSADYCILKNGDGWFGLINSNEFFPSRIKTFTFEEIDGKADEDHLWHPAAVTFNTGGYTKIGFVVCDDGGEAYINDLRLFKTANATVRNEQNNFPKKITSSTLRIDDSFITQNDAVTINSIVSRLDNKQYIRVFKDGTEITDLNQKISTGVQLRLMDGPSVYDRVDIALMGDINGDGVCDKKDAAIVTDSLINRVTLTKLQTKALDYDKNGTGDINDAVLLVAKINSK